MKNLDFDFNFKTLPGVPPIDKKAGELFAEILATHTSEVIPPLKAWEYAQKLNETKKLKDVSTEDVDLLKRFVLSLKGVSNMISAQLLQVLS